MSLVKLIVALTVLGVTGPARTESVGHAHDPASPQEQSVLRFSSSLTPTPAFENVVDHPPGSNDTALAGYTANRLPDAARLSPPASGPARLPPVAGAHPQAALLSEVSKLSGAIGDLSGAVIRADYPVPGAAGGGGASANFLFPIDEIPEPAGWMTLVCGLAVAAFMARRKRPPFDG